MISPFLLVFERSFCALFDTASLLVFVFPRPFPAAFIDASASMKPIAHWDSRCDADLH